MGTKSELAGNEQHNGRAMICVMKIDMHIGNILSHDLTRNVVTSLGGLLLRIPTSDAQVSAQQHA